MAHFFISYSSKDRAKADEIRRLLIADGATCWIAPDCIDPGEPFPLAIPKAIQECQVFLLIFSEHSDSSVEVMSEVILARKYDRRLVTLRLNDHLPRKLEYLLVAPQWIDWHKPGALDRLRRLYVSQPAAGNAKTHPKDGMTYVWVEPGTFLMGGSPDDDEAGADERPSRPVTITIGYWIGQTPVKV